MGTNNYQTKIPGDVIQSADPNQYKEGLGENIVPRNVSGVPTDVAGSLGTTILRWVQAFFSESIYFGVVADDAYIKIADSNTSIPELQIRAKGPSAGGKAISITRLGLNGAGLKDESVGTTQLEDDAVTEDKIGDSEVTLRKIGAPNYTGASSDTGLFSTASSSFVTVTNATTGLTCTGTRPVELHFRGAYLTTNVANDNLIIWRLSRNGTNISGEVNGRFNYIDFNAPAGVNTYTLETRTTGVGNSLVSYMTLIAREIL